MHTNPYGTDCCGGEGGPLPPPSAPVGDGSNQDVCITFADPEMACAAWLAANYTCETKWSDVCAKVDSIICSYQDQDRFETELFHDESETLTRSRLGWD